MLSKEQIRILLLIKKCHSSTKALVLPFGENQKIQNDLIALHSLFLKIIQDELLQEAKEEEEHACECSPYTNEQIAKWAKADRKKIYNTIKNHQLRNVTK